MRKTGLVSLLLLTGCTTLSDYQDECERRYAKLSEVAICLDTHVENDYRLSGTLESVTYVMTARQLGQAVDEGKMSDAQARSELQALYLYIQHPDFRRHEEMKHLMGKKSGPGEQAIMNPPGHLIPSAHTTPVKSANCSENVDNASCQSD